ncbi:hypothetical protein K443DRAFT_597453 [Laccaria amethystina LaAM-08-1]|jgi:hypothetical protein|uniref:Secreted protein n=1 Tax=Laccaria amethystina LaAM-08-1 TaxID=1095629 RepID=A0A0C9XXU7_9AGAR|nr:hypothetical protein K443DRAFT_597453 [Laccaria amethystina LaAM-08-1]
MSPSGIILTPRFVRASCLWLLFFLQRRLFSPLFHDNEASLLSKVYNEEAEVNLRLNHVTVVGHNHNSQGSRPWSCVVGSPLLIRVGL